jgi:hypothetical protein
MCTVLLPPGGNPISVTYIISHIISYNIISYIISYHNVRRPNYIVYDNKDVLHDDDHLMVVIWLILQTFLLCLTGLCIFRTKSVNPQFWCSPCRGDCLIAAADLDGFAGGNVATGKTSHAGDFEGEKPDPERNHGPSGLLGVCDGLATRPGKIVGSIRT